DSTFGPTHRIKSGQNCWPADSPQYKRPTAKKASLSFPPPLLLFLPNNTTPRDIQTNQKGFHKKTMATEVAAAAVPPPQLDAEENSGLEEAAAEAKIQPSSGPHKLERKWTFWFDNQSKPKQVLLGVPLFARPTPSKPLYDQVFKPSKFPPNADFHLFRAGVEPKWEDPECANGGKWTVTSRSKASLDTMWLETLMALIGEQFDEADEICGVVASVRQRQDKLALWTRNAANEAAQMGIGRKWKEIIDVTDKITYSFHDDSKRERSAKPRYNV
ncbi:Eukaryotic initiation factor 4E protein, partial [Prunus dulcis]